MKIKFCGASTGVTGSCHLLTSGEHKILLDCGQFQGGKAQDALNYEKFPFEPSEIECVVLSHAHIDHCGRLPLLTKRGFEGKIYCTDATADLLSVMLKDSAYIHEKETEWKNRKAERAGREQVEPLYTIEDAEKTLSLVSPILYDQQIEINSDMKIVFNDAGHILGSAITELWVTEDDKESKIVFSGDLGMEGRPILRDPTYIKKADYVIMETTYGNRIHKELGSGVEKLIEIILNTTRRGGNVVIPSFAVGRTQELIYELNRFYDSNNEYRKELDKIFVYIDSPMATTATEIFRRNAQVFDEETREYILKGDNPLEFKNLKFTRSSKESQDLNFNKEPKIIISASGMCEAGRIRHHLKHNLWNPKNSIVFVGYQGQGTLGRSLVEGIKMVTLFGEEIQVNAEIHNLEGFSGHADQNGLFAWLAHFEQKPKQIFLVHGEEESKKDFAKLVNEKLSYEPIVVMGNSEFELDMNKSEIVNMDSAREQAAEADKIQKVRDKLSSIHLDLEQILYSANLAVEENISDKKITLINNIIQELEKSTINLATAVNEDNGLREEK
ncbi:MAG: MBL fold metallo-hydrolase [[Eubacterium] sulci]|nr:MBL fold metallo-hydrolase [[Eubacterium] sulci]MBF1170065.1 MBL fold metallo-hydrolase [[Eubacterium] sulci]